MPKSLGRWFRPMIVVLLSACVAAGCGGPAPEVARHSQPDPSPTAAPTTPDEGFSGSDVPVVDRMWSWEVINEKPIDDGIAPIFDGTNLVTSNSRDDGRDITVRKLDGGGIVLQHEAAADYVVEEVFIVGEWLVIEELEAVPTNFDIHLYRYSLVSGKGDEITGMQSVPVATDPQMASDSQFLYYATGDSKTGKCEVSLDVDLLRARTVYCAAPGWMVSDPAPSDDVFTLSETLIEADARCKRILTFNESGEPSTVAPAERECDQWSGAATNNAVAWSEVDPVTDERLELSPGYIRVEDRLIRLGNVETGSFVACEGWIYWSVEESSDGRRISEMRRWNPKQGTVEVILRPKDQANTVLSKARCVDGHLTVTALIHGPDVETTITSLGS